ncbi:MAG: apolipoprotein N-acyltransferase [Spirochaetia bacterium]
MDLSNSIRKQPYYRFYYNVFLTLLSGIIFPLSLPNELFLFGHPGLGIICLVPYIIALIHTSKFKEATLLGVLFGAVSTLLSSYWLVAFGDFSIWTLGGTTLGYMLYNAMLSPFLLFVLRSKPQVRPFLFALLWASYEFLKSSGYLAYPWGLIVYPINTILPLMQIADITGPWGISFLMAFTNALTAEAILLLKEKGAVTRGLLKTYFARSAAFWLIIVSAILLYGGFRLNMEYRNEGTLRIVLVQQNIDPWQTGMREDTSLETGVRLSQEGLEQGHADIVSWCETAFRRPYSSEPHSFYGTHPEDTSFLELVKQSNTYYLIGAPHWINREELQISNAVLLIRPDSRIEDYYAKQHPVPFAETAPLWEIPAVQNFYRNVIGLHSQGWTMGDRDTIFTIPLEEGGTLSFATPICFEDAFGYLCSRMIREGAQMLINLTNDSWSKTYSAETQHFVAARLRSIENRRTLIRSTNGGYTTIIAPSGEVTHSMEMFTADSIHAEVPVLTTENFTVYTVLGDYLPKAFLIILLLFLLLVRISNTGRFRFLQKYWLFYEQGHNNR